MCLCECEAKVSNVFVSTCYFYSFCSICFSSSLNSTILCMHKIHFMSYCTWTMNVKDNRHLWNLQMNNRRNGSNILCVFDVRSNLMTFFMPVEIVNGVEANYYFVQAGTLFSYTKLVVLDYFSSYLPPFCLLFAMIGWNEKNIVTNQ